MISPLCPAEEAVAAVDRGLPALLPQAGDAIDLLPQAVPLEDVAVVVTQFGPTYRRNEDGDRPGGTE